MVAGGATPGELGPGELRPGELRPGELRPGELRIVGTTVAREIDLLLDRVAQSVGRRAPRVLQVGSRTLVADRNVRNWRNLVANARANRLPANLPPAQASVLANALALFLPAGLLIRTTQIVGSFCLLNGISHALDVSRTDE